MSVTTSVPALARKALFGSRDGAQQLAALGEVAPDALVLGVHRVADRDERDDAARTHLVEHLGGKVVVDEKPSRLYSGSNTW